MLEGIFRLWVDIAKQLVIAPRRGGVCWKTYGLDCIDPYSERIEFSQNMGQTLVL